MGTITVTPAGSEESFTNLGSFTWANKPSAAASTGKTFFCTNIDNGVLLYSDGSVWRNPSNAPINILQLSVPVILQSSGTVGANGALSGITAFPANAVSSAYLYFPAGKAFSGSSAGFYYTVMNTTSTGTIYNNVYTSGSPNVPTSLVPIVDAGPGAYTQTTSEVTAVQFTIQSGFLGLHGQLTENRQFFYNTAAGTKTFRQYFGSSFPGNSTRTTSGGHDSFTTRHKLVGTQAKISSYSISESSSTSSTGFTVSNEDFSLNVIFKYTLQIDTATNYAGFIGAQVLATPT